uniref:Uncharacterized protein n=1 Tax=Anopheles culicifacies TaxID=139723 RepID=A0A182LXZ6_9DIPT
MSCECICVTELLECSDHRSPLRWGGVSLPTRSDHQPPGHLSAIYGIREKARQTRRYQLTVIDILADYIRFRCEYVTRFLPPIQPAALLRECNRIVGSMFVIFDGSMELMTLTLLRITPDRATHTLLLYPLFENILTSVTYHNDYDTIPGYVRMLLCFKRWKSLVSGRTEKASIDAQAIQLLPGRCPTVQHASDLSFLRLLPPIPPGQRVVETRYLLVNDLFSLEHCIAQYLRHHRRTASSSPMDQTATKQRNNNTIRQRRLWWTLPANPMTSSIDKLILHQFGSRIDIFSGDERHSSSVCFCTNAQNAPIVAYLSL